MKIQDSMSSAQSSVISRRLFLNVGAAAAAAAALSACSGGGDDQTVVAAEPTTPVPTVPTTPTIPTVETPVANDDTATTVAGEPVLIRVLDNDAPPGQGYLINSVSSPANGTVEIVQNEGIRYTPKAGFTGTDSFQYYVAKNGKNSNGPATVTVTVLSGYVTPTLPASLPDISVGDNGGINPVTFAISMPPALDVNGNQIPYNVAGLPATDGFGTPVTWNKSQTGATIYISGTYMGSGVTGTIHTYPLSITSTQATGITSENLKIETN